MKQEIVVDVRPEGLVWITVDRAAKHNALALPVLDALAHAVREAGAQPQTKVVMLRGAGQRYFAAGGDVVELTAVRTPAQIHAMCDAATGALDAVRQCPVPVVAYLNGDAIGGGAELAVACDFRAMASHARIGFVQGQLAISTAWGGGPDLCELVGAARALRMMAQAELVDCAQALQWGLADLELPDGPDGPDLAAWLQPMLQRTRTVLEGFKAQARAWRDGASRQRRRELERSFIVDTWTSDEHWAAVNRFLQRERG